MKKLINDPSGLVREMLEGAARQAPGTALLGDEHVLVRSDLPAAERRPVAVISGGGSGHEPAHAGYVGAGMLSAAVCGEVFTSPSTDAVLAAIRATAGPNGALLIVKNYTGDRLNFGLAAELARAEGIPVEIAIVADDVSLRHTPRERRRGIAGTVLVHKIAGAAAALGLPLAQVAAAAREAAAQLGSMGVALGGCTLPGAEKSGFTLADNEIELGLGIHGEKGVERSAMLPADQLTATLLDYIVEDMGLAAGARVALLVNGLGATPQMELDVVMRAAYDKLAARGIAVERAWSGTLLSALDMPGCSLSVLRVDDGRLALLDAATGARAWPGGGRVNQDIHVAAPAMEQGEAQAAPDAAGQRWIAALKPALVAAAAALHAKEPTLTELDSLAGDGDLGASMKRAADAILAVPTRPWPIRLARWPRWAARCARPSPAVPARSTPPRCCAPRAGWREARRRARLGRRVQRCCAGRQRPGRSQGRRPDHAGCAVPGRRRLRAGPGPGRDACRRLRRGGRGRGAGARRRPPPWRRAPAAPATWASARSVRRTAAPSPWPAGWRRCARMSGPCK